MLSKKSADRLVGEATMPAVMASPIDIQVSGIDEAERFYRAELGCTEFETTCESLKFNWGRNRIHCTLSAQAGTAGKGARIYRLFAGKYQVLPNFTVELTRKEWNAIARHLSRRRVGFMLGVSHSKGQPGSALFLVDPSGNVVELKATRSLKDQQRQRFYRLAAGILAVVAMAAVVWWASEARTDSFHVQEQPPPTTRPFCAVSVFCAQ